LGLLLTGERVERRLAAVLAADVAGYSRLVGADEEGTLARLKSVRKALVDPTIAAHRGRIVKTTGDGMLVEFASAVDAVRSAVEVQRGMAEQNATLPQDTRIEFRIGIHVGDIIFDDNDIFGDGVNIGARLEGIAEPGGAFACRMTLIGKSGARSKLAATTLGRRPSKTLPSRCGRGGFCCLAKTLPLGNPIRVWSPHKFCRYPINPPSRYCLSRT
jgi:class 3 adenylate cyclase